MDILIKNNEDRLPISDVGNSQYSESWFNALYTDDKNTNFETLAYLWKFYGAAREQYDAHYNRVTGFFELNGLSDITFSEALRILADATRSRIGAYIRTNFEPMVYDGFPDRTGQSSLSCEILSVQGLKPIDKHPSMNYDWWWSRCANLHTILGDIDMKNGCTSNAFSYSNKLANLSIINAANTCNLTKIVSLSNDSLLYLIENTDSECTVILTTDVYDRCMADDRITDALAIKTNVTLTTS